MTDEEKKDQAKFKSDHSKLEGLRKQIGAKEKLIIDIKLALKWQPNKLFTLYLYCNYRYETLHSTWSAYTLQTIKRNRSYHSPITKSKGNFYT